MDKVSDGEETGKTRRAKAAYDAAFETFRKTVRRMAASEQAMRKWENLTLEECAAVEHEAGAAAKAVNAAGKKLRELFVEWQKSIHGTVSMLAYNHTLTKQALDLVRDIKAEADGIEDGRDGQG